MTNTKGEFPDLSAENLRAWNANAEWWDDRIGDGNDFQLILIEPATHRLLDVRRGENVLDVACGAGRFSRQLAQRGACVVAVDQSERFIERARRRTTPGAGIDYRVLDATDRPALLALGGGRFDKAVSNMALMDMSRIEPLLGALFQLLKPGGCFVFSMIHPVFQAPDSERFVECRDGEDGRVAYRAGIKVSQYLTPQARKGEGIVGQPEAQYYFYRPLRVLLGTAFEAGFVMNGVEEPAFPLAGASPGRLRWDDMPEIPPILVVRLLRP
jgi:2-polyprenyl-3-methyl-5-hydroxy-6-metoxy-1,4-benzoquinol methylase